LNSIDLKNSNKKIFIKFDQMVIEIPLIKVIFSNFKMSII
jgi:hypothetical protein